MEEKGFIVLTDQEYEWARQQFGREYADRMRRACRKVETRCINLGITISETNARLRKTCLRLLVDFVKKGDPRLYTVADNPAIRTII